MAKKSSGTEVSGHTSVETSSMQEEGSEAPKAAHWRSIPRHSEQEHCVEECPAQTSIRTTSSSHINKWRSRGSLQTCPQLANILARSDYHPLRASQSNVLWMLRSVILIAENSRTLRCWRGQFGTGPPVHWSSPKTGERQLMLAQRRD